MEGKYISKNANQTQKIAADLAEKILNSKRIDKAVLLGLKGELGGGKTTFLQGFADGLDIKEKILSPTFIIIRRFDINHDFFENFYHIDCYRIKNSKEIVDLRFYEIISNPKNIIAIEWIENIEDIINQDFIVVRFKFLDEEKREILIKDKKI